MDVAEPSTLATAAALVLGTFVSEDLTCITAGMLLREGRIDGATAVASCTLGIFAGDVGLYALGRLARPMLHERSFLARFLPVARLGQVRGTLNQHVGKAVLLSRFTPGARLPLYVAAGMAGTHWASFAFWMLIAAMLWTPVLVLGSYALGEAFAHSIGRWLGSAGIALTLSVLLIFVIVRLLERLATRDGRLQLAIQLGRAFRWEFWPSWLFYLPLLPWIAWLSLRHGGLRTIACVNPGIELGGIVGESKSRILAQLPADRVASFVLITAGPLDQRLAAAEELARDHGWPIILKPDAGQRGLGLKLAHNPAQAAAYLQANPHPIIAQAYVPGPFEAGIFYFRHPDQARGRIFSITDKEFPVVQGDGQSTLQQLIEQHPRYRLQASVFLARHQDKLSEVLAKGKRMTLAIAGNHCQGTLFRDGSHLATPELEAVIDHAARQFEGFYFGRFDVRYSTVEGFKAGRDFKILELNGATSESTNIYDPSRSLWQAYSTLGRQWQILFKIAQANRRRGTEAPTLSAIWAQIQSHYRDRRASVLAD